MNAQAVTMMGIVQELVQVIGGDHLNGNVNATKSGESERIRRSAKGHGKKDRVVRTEQMIPLDEADFIKI
jgi:hypothetical protein